MCGQMLFAAGSRARLLDGSDVAVLARIEDENQYRVRILTGPPILMVRRGRLVRVRDITVPAENVEPLLDGVFAAPAGGRC